MIRLHRTRVASSLDGFCGKKLEEKLEKLLDYYYSDGGSVTFKPKQRQLWRDSKEALKAESFGKCSYCEADTSVVAYGDVEHFRPKDSYWWLAYCYDNYVYSCQICNQKFKGVQFPITGTKLLAPKIPQKKPPIASMVTAISKTLCPDPTAVKDKDIKALFSLENAHLPNPYLTNPEKVFAWRADDTTKEVRVVARGRSVIAKNALDAAETALGLNRTELLRLRWLHYDTLRICALAIETGKIGKRKKAELEKKLKDQANDDKPFAAMKRYFLKKWGY